MNEWVREDASLVRQPGARDARRPFTRFDQQLRSRVLQQFRGMREGYVTVVDACGTVTLGQPATPGSDLACTVEIMDPRFYRSLVASGSVGTAEAYMDGYWRCSDLTALVRLLVRNRDYLDAMEGGVAAWAGAMMRLSHWLQRNTHVGSRRNIARHYDLGNEFFRLFLSDDLMYSAAIWDGADDTLNRASTRKLDVICSRLDLQPGDRIIEIGSGWGGFALHAARNYGCHVTTTTISAEQYELAQQRIREAGLGERITLLRQDYRDLSGTFDKLVSIEMIEAVGAAFLDGYFTQLGRLLRPGGLALLQAITIEDHRYEQALRSVDFIQRHIFPGSFIPSVNALLAAKTRASDLALIHMEDFGASYARTIRAWRESFMAHLPEVRAQGFDDRFIRMWEFYLAYCEGGFEERSIGVAHLLMRRPSN
jgi:cyclopropane-fatty-acyl-phospholipid synthase